MVLLPNRNTKTELLGRFFHFYGFTRACEIPRAALQTPREHAGSLQAKIGIPHLASGNQWESSGLP